MEAESGNLHDWELLHNSSDSNSLNSSHSAANLTELENLDSESQGMIQTDYFSLDSHVSYLNKTAGSISDQGSVAESDNPSWVDPDESESRFAGKPDPSRELWPDSSSDRSELDCHENGFVRNENNISNNEGIGELISDIKSNNEMGFVQNENNEMGFVQNENNISNNEAIEKLSYIGSNNEMGFVRKENNEMGFVRNENNISGNEGIGELSDIKSNNEMGFVQNESNISSNEEIGDKGIELNSEAGGDPMKVAKSENNKKVFVVWWKVPLEVLKFCAFRVRNPVWTFSAAAAAIMGFVILSRRLSKMMEKKKVLVRSKLNVDDKVSQFMSRAARLNEAFSMVKRVPVIRPAMPAAGGLTQWPVMSLR